MLAEGVLLKNRGSALLNKGSAQTALKELAKAKKILETLEQQADAKGPAWLYLADVACLQGQAYQSLPTPDLAEAQRAFGTCQGYALNIAQGGYCTQYAGLATAFCLDAKRLAEEVQERLDGASAGQ